MAHVSTNPAWQDYPDTSTLITANALENIEAAIDAAATQGSVDGMAEVKQDLVSERLYFEAGV